MFKTSCDYRLRSDHLVVNGYQLLDKLLYGFLTFFNFCDLPPNYYCKTWKPGKFFIKVIFWCVNVEDFLALSPGMWQSVMIIWGFQFAESTPNNAPCHRPASAHARWSLGPVTGNQGCIVCTGTGSPVSWRRRS